MQVNDIVFGRVERIYNNNLTILIKGSVIGKLYISEISDYFIDDLSYLFEINKEYQFKILKIYTHNKVELTWKLIHPNFLKNPFRYFIKETTSGFNKLWNNTLKEVKND